MRLRIDRSLCTGHGRCYVMHPELFRADDEGMGLAINRDISEPPRGVLMDCPERAIVLDETVPEPEKEP